MTLEPHPHIKFVTIEHEFALDGKSQAVAVVHTDLELSDQRPGYDEKTWQQLVGHIQAWQKSNKQQVRLRKV